MENLEGEPENVERGNMEKAEEGEEREVQVVTPLHTIQIQSPPLQITYQTPTMDEENIEVVGVH